MKRLTEATEALRAPQTPGEEKQQNIARARALIREMQPHLTALAAIGEQLEALGSLGLTCYDLYLLARLAPQLVADAHEYGQPS